MCPDPQVLSIYLDGELPSPWKEKMEAHLSACPKCKEKLENYKRMHDLFKRGASHIPEVQRRVIVERDGSEINPAAETSETEILEKSKERVWKKLAGKHRYSSAGSWKNGNIRGYSLWRRRLSVPLPVAAAAALLIIFGVMLYTQNANNSNNQITEFPNFIEEMPYDYLPSNVSNDINSVLQYLDANGADIIILQLPESKNFSRAGEPAIIRAADYPRIEDTTPRRLP